LCNQFGVRKKHHDLRAMAHRLVVLLLMFAIGFVALWRPSPLRTRRFGRFLSAAGASIESGGNVQSWSSPGTAQIQQELLNDDHCHDAVPGEACYNDTTWAKDYGINTRPQWYPGLTNESSFADFQAHLHYCHWDRCPMPCANTSQQKCEMVGRFWSSENCEDATLGTRCYLQLRWIMGKGIKLQPQSYAPLTERSSIRQFQARLFQRNQSGLETSRCPEPCCHDALQGERCHEDATWAMLYGITIPEISHAYPPSLTNQSEFAEFQAYLHLCYPDSALSRARPPRSLPRSMMPACIALTRVISDELHSASGALRGTWWSLFRCAAIVRSRFDATCYCVLCRCSGMPA